MSSRQPIFVLGILGRSGTNFLRDLLVLHPECAAPEGVPEDHLLHHSDRLIEYAEAVTEQWVDKSASDPLLRRIAEGALGELIERCAGLRLVTKTPSIRNLAVLERVFPVAIPVVVVRDGRSVAESYVRSFGANYEGVMHRWAAAAREIIDAQRATGPGGSALQLVRYEALCEDPEATLRDLFGHVDLDPSVYDFDAARRLPVRGSSESARSAEGLHWTPVERTERFDPAERWSTWDERRHDRFNWIAGREMIELGYGLVGTAERGSSPVNRALDLGWAASQRLRLIAPARRIVGKLGMTGRL